MNEREKIIRLWFDMWIKKADLGIDNIFTDDVVYTESWSPKYENRKTVKHWFDEWNTRGSVLVWEIKQFFHQGNQTIVEWYFSHCVHQLVRDDPSSGKYLPNSLFSFRSHLQWGLEMADG